MVLGLIDFLLGRKKKEGFEKKAQVSSVHQVGDESNSFDSNNLNSNSENMNNLNGQNNAQNTNNSNLEFQDSNSSNNSNLENNSNFNQNLNQNSSLNSNANKVNKKSISEILNKINKQIKDTNDSVVNLVSEVKDVSNQVSNIEHRVSELETQGKDLNEKLEESDENMSKFLSLYELVNNQYNPFVEKQDLKKEIIIDTNSNSENVKNINLKEKINNLPTIDLENSNQNNKEEKEDDSLENSLLELDTLDIEQAAADAVPLTQIKSNTNSLVIILSWLEYLVKKVGIEEARNGLRYYTETLKWITPEVFFELDKFLRGMDDDLSEKKNSGLCVKDHIVSLYFISKLNEKFLDERLTKAVLKIIKN